MERQELTALWEWQEQVVACRGERWETEDEVWQRAAGWYDDWVRHNDYVDLVLPRLLQRVGPTARVLEVGPGSGAFTLPLARLVQQLVAVEPSAHLRSVLTHNLAKGGVTNVHLVSQKIEDAVETLDGPFGDSFDYVQDRAQGRLFDLALASYSLYNVEPINSVIRGLVRRAHHVVALMGTGERREWYRALHRRFRGKDPTPPPQVQHFYPMLLEMGVYADVEILWTSYNYVHDSEDALVEWWMRRFHLEETDRAELRTALLPLAERRGNHIGIYDWGRTAVVWIESGRSVTGAAWGSRDVAFTDSVRPCPREFSTG